MHHISVPDDEDDDEEEGDAVFMPIKANEEDEPVRYSI